MIKKTLLLTLVMFGLHHVVVTKVAPNLEVIRHQWQRNNLVAERFIFNDTKYDDVMIGSSLSARLLPGQLNGIYNLSFSGQSCLDGLEVLMRKDPLPKRIFIEFNVIMRPVDQSFTDAFTNPMTYYPRKYLAGLREGKKPIDWMAQYAIVPVNFVRARIRSAVSTTGDSTNTTGNLLFEQNMDRLVERYSKPPGDKVMSGSLAKLKTYVDQLTSKGVEVIFFEMPINARLCNAPWPNTVRKDMEDAFPRDRYRYIDMPDCSDYHTTDGLHLSPAEASRYAKYFMEQAF